MEDCWKCWSVTTQTVFCIFPLRWSAKNAWEITSKDDGEIHSITSTWYCVPHCVLTTANLFIPLLLYTSVIFVNSFSDFSCKLELRRWPTTATAGGCIPKTVGSSWLQEADYFIVTVLAHILALNLCKSLEGYLNKREPPASGGISLEGWLWVVIPMHHLAGLVQTLSLCLVHTRAHTHARQKEGLMHTRSRCCGANTPQNML